MLILVKQKQRQFSPFSFLFVCRLPQVTQLTNNVGLNTDQVLQTMLSLGKKGTGFRLEAAMHKALFAFSGFFGCWWVLQYSWGRYNSGLLGKWDT